VTRRLDVSAPGEGAIAVGGDIGSAWTTHIGTQVLGMAAVPVAAAARDPGPIFTATGVDTFTGRGWLAGEVDRFIASNPCGYVFVEAEAGLGKTAFAAWLVKTRGYLSHFSRYSGGRSVRVALQNLSAQLVRDFGLDEQAPGGMLPEWAQAPGGFESVLGMASRRARERGLRLVLVVDGLDEAEPSGEGLAFGLPSLLPDGVYVVGTYRTGHWPGRPDSPAVTVLIGKDDLRNRRDIREFLTKAAGEEVLAARLAEASIDPADFVAVLAERCEGVWVYLRYVLQELRIGLRRPDAIGDLPSGLWNYYVAQIRYWQNDPAWDESLLPLLATLGVAGEPLPTVVLARLAGDLDTVAVRRWCDFTFRPLLTTTRAPGVSAPLRYEIYHASFRQVLKALPGEQSLDPREERPYELQALANELREATVAAHGRIADTYLSCFGGLTADLPVLAKNPGAASIDDGYPLRHLGRHLLHARRAADLHRLLGVAHPVSSGREDNVWFAAHDHADCLVSYLDDLARARQAAAAATDQALAQHQSGPALSTEIRYALMASSIASRAAGISAELLGLLIRAGIWSPRRGLDHARSLNEPSDRFDALVAVHLYLNTDEQSAVVAEALAAATAITDERRRAWALTALAEHLPPDLLAQALTAATAITDDYVRVVALTGLAPHLLPNLLAQALAVATAITDEDARAGALTGLAEHLPSGLAAQALATATAIATTDDHRRVEALTALAPQLPPDQRASALGQALAAATAITYDYSRAQALTALAPQLLPDQRASVLAEALATATAITDERWRAQALTALAPQLPPDQRASVLAEALTAATAITHDYLRAEALTALAERLPPDLLAQALATATAITDDYSRTKALSGLAEYLPPDLLARALAAATAITNDYDRAEALTGLAEHLPPDLLAPALDTATAITGEDARARALTALAPHLSSDQRASVLAQALAAATAITGEDARVEALTALAEHLPADQRASVLAQALATATATTDEDARARALIALAEHLPPDLLTSALDTAAAITSDYARARALTGLAQQLPPDQRASVLAQALAIATAIADEGARARALSALAEHLPLDLLAPALDTAAAITDENFRTEALTALAPHLPTALVVRALTAATATTDEDARARALSALAEHLPPDLLAPALDTAAAITDDYARGRTLSTLAEHLPPDLLALALDATTAITWDSARAWALSALAEHLPPDLLAQALDTAAAITDDYGRAEALTGLGPHLPPEQGADVLAQALAAATAITDDSDRAWALTGLAPHLPPEQQADVLAQALAATTAITDDYVRPEAFSCLAEYLPADLLAQALDAAAAIAGDSARAEALSALAEYLPPDLLGQALAATPKESIQAITALLDRGQSIFSSERNGTLLGLLRASLGGIDRISCLSIITLMAPTIAEIGGSGAVQECIKAITDVHRWWP
jgi:hypothetical protein